MAQAALSYQQPQRRTRELDYPVRPPLRVLPGKAPSTRSAPALSPIWRMLFAVSIAAMLFLGLLAVARVGLAGATMTLSVESAKTSKAIEEARSVGARLEVEYHLASNPVTILEEASQLGLALDPQIEYIHIKMGD